MSRESAKEISLLVHRLEELDVLCCLVDSVQFDMVGSLLLTPDGSDASIQAPGVCMQTLPWCKYPTHQYLLTHTQSRSLFWIPILFVIHPRR